MVGFGRSSSQGTSATKALSLGSGLKLWLKLGLSTSAAAGTTRDQGFQHPIPLGRRSRDHMPACIERVRV
eukprot:78254-Rhodomonas_salina.1